MRENSIFHLLTAQSKLERITMNLNNFLLLFKKFREDNETHETDELIQTVTDIEQTLLRIVLNQETFTRHEELWEVDENE